MEYSSYREHPRIIELKFSYIHTLFSTAFGIEKTAELFRTFCNIGRINWTIISSTIGRKDMITNMNYTNKLRYRQEVVLMGLAYGENRIDVGKRYLGLSKRMMYEYRDNLLKPESFIDSDWLHALDYSVQIAGTDAYKLEMLRFIELVISLKEVI